MIIAGAGGFAREVLEVLNQLKEEHDVLFYDDINSTAEFVYSKYKIIAGITHENQDDFFILGIGTPNAREMLYNKMIQNKLNPYTLISPLAQIGSNNISIGLGSTIMTGSILTCDISIGIGALINLGCTIGHDVKIGDFSDICPNVSISGNVEIGNNVFIGTGAVILPGIKIGDHAVIGAGAIITKDIPSKAVAVGNPAKW